MQKKEKFQHSVTENGKIQVRIVTEYQDDSGNIVSKKYGNPMTPADPNVMDGWDDKSKDIVGAIMDPVVKADFEIERQDSTGIGLEEIITADRVIDEDGKIAIRRITRIFDDGKEVSKKYHRNWILPGDDIASSDVISKAVAKKLHTEKAVSDYKNKQIEIKEGLG